MALVTILDRYCDWTSDRACRVCSATLFARRVRCSFATTWTCARTATAWSGGTGSVGSRRSIGWRWTASICRSRSPAASTSCVSYSFRLAWHAKRSDVSYLDPVCDWFHFFSFIHLIVVLKIGFLAWFRMGNLQLWGGKTMRVMMNFEFCDCVSFSLSRSIVRRLDR